ncbi:MULTISPECIES: hypothetical protein [Natrialbaceae]|uniref:hypothetical protein n=1 Tax=Natrialbaceae TaxID=1644061 RepID=UPI00207CA4BC|nr:hypothetical protein [Natronococcus sp. CG52]
MYTVVVDGEIVLEDGAVRTVDEEAILERATDRATDVFDRAAGTRRDADPELADYVEEGWLWLAPT